MTVWTSPARAALAGQLLDVMGAAVRPLGVGGPRSAELDTLGKQLDCPAGDDLRKLLIERPAAFLVVTSLRDATVADLRAAAEAGTRVICLEPLAAELDELSQVEAHAVASGVTVAPAFLQSPGYRSAADPHDPLGRPRLIRFTSLGRPTHGSLLARLIDAWNAVLEFTALPETIHASLTGPRVPVRQITGQLAAHAQVADGGSVLLEMTDAATHTRRELSVVSAAAQLKVTDAGYELRQRDGRVLDAGGDPDAQPTFVDLVADQWRRLMDRMYPGPGPEGANSAGAQALACVHACLLSARTGQPERPGKLLELIRA